MKKRHTRVMKVPKKNIEIAGEWDNFIGATLLQSILPYETIYSLGLNFSFISQIFFLLDKHDQERNV